MINQIFDKILISYTEPESKNVLWFDPNKREILYYSDGWKSLFALLIETKQDKIDDEL